MKTRPDDHKDKPISTAKPSTTSGITKPHHTSKRSHHRAPQADIDWPKQLPQKFTELRAASQTATPSQLRSLGEFVIGRRGRYLPRINADFVFRMLAHFTREEPLSEQDRLKYEGRKGKQRVKDISEDLARAKRLGFDFGEDRFSSYQKVDEAEAERGGESYDSEEGGLDVEEKERVLGVVGEWLRGTEEGTGEEAIASGGKNA